MVRFASGTMPVVALLAMLAGCASPPVRSASPAHPYALAAPPSSCVTVPAGERLADTVARAHAGESLCLATGAHPGPAVVDKPLHIWGLAGAVIVSSGVGTTVEITAPGTTITGGTIDGSGTRYDLDDAAIKIHANDVTVEGVHIVHATFGILGEQVLRAVVRGNEVRGDGSLPFGLRGDAIRLWEARDSVVTDNVVTNGRDVVLWYSSHNRFLRNRVRGSRYGTHLMYCHDNEIRGNVYQDDVVGVFAMYSHNLRIVDNDIAGMSGAAGMGIGLKESGNVELRGNRFVGDVNALYVDTSPLSLGDHDTAIGNEFFDCQTAILFHGRADRNTFRDNTFRSNGDIIAVDGGDDALAAIWDHNYYDDYAGYDLDGDGTGDVPHEERSLGTLMVDRHPSLGYFRGTPALGVVDAIGRLVPLFTPRELLADARPRMGPYEVRGAR